MKSLLLLMLSVSSFAASAQTSADTTIQFHVAGACGQCKQRIEKALHLPGISKATWDVSTQQATVRYDPSKLKIEALHAAVAGVGHDTELQKAEAAVYQKLPECCLYREMTEPAASAPTEDSSLLRGLVIEKENDQARPLAGATVQWLGSSSIVRTNSHGEFQLPFNTTTPIVISYAGFRTDTVSAGGMKDIEIVLQRKESLGAVIVTARSRTMHIDANSPFRTAIISRKELLKAACCNLSESFETNPSVDVSYSDAATGSKQIQLLGLAGPYSQLTVENLPGPRGLATPWGLNSIAGPWVESIQLIKGTGSVVNGFESIAGQINVELRKPRTSEKLYLNGYVNSMGKTDLNLNWAHRINEKWSTGLLLHNAFLFSKQDANDDGFRDLPTGNLFSGVHRWQYLGDQGLTAQFGVKALVDNKVGGQLGFEPSKHKYSTSIYGLGIDTRRYEGFAKIGYVFPEALHRSLGLQASVSDHRTDAYFGVSDYDARQRNLYLNGIYQTQIGSEEHGLKTGLSLVSDRYDEQLKGIPYDRKETVAGVFAEYSFKPSTKFDLVAGLRADRNSLYGWFATPRLNVRYAPFAKTTIRLSAGRGQRTPAVFAENIGVLVSSRNLVLPAANGKAYGLEPEVSWNKGLSLDQGFRVFGREANLGLDFFRNDFLNQAVLDLEDPRTAKWANLEGASFSNSLQAEFSFFPVKKLEARLAWRYFDVRTTYGGTLLEKPFTAKHRAFLNLAYEWKGFKLDYTVNGLGRKRLPATASNPVEHRLPAYSPSFVTMNSQVSKSFGKKKLFDLYIGGENLTNYLQRRSILAADMPFSDHFDAAMIWGPVNGRVVYGGFRYTVK